ncbi:organomercurial transporter MerC [endosymbiont of unidentified scaly snail isolate Monju]|uniref:organomercurial transporter MerC n=1 Tax=endosymbiont of unidentified scaly snail isolate Monju TaxID=1248727 RepID=UPI000389257F|nr:organomercurial transporter MerC [endosymbiont of unidentified scaly snail isolate Monju]BAN69942.1 mercury transport protein MerC [endosymbiont of unidentified scaly snail isolate Monju]
MWFARLFENAGAFGSVLAALSCASCFPALGALGAALGLSGLARFEGMALNTLLPVFAGIALAANVLGFLSHRVWHRLLAGIAGPAMVLATLYLFWTEDWSTWMFYAGLVLMVVVAIADLVSPPGGRRCKTCEVGNHG